MPRNQMRRFPPGVSENLMHYVYTLHDPREQNRLKPFYIGKGFNNDRAFDHFHEAEKNLNGKKVGRINDIWNAGHDVSVFIHRYGLSEDQALHVEAALIELFPEASNEVEGQHSWKQGRIFVDDLCSRLAPELAVIDFAAVLINIRTEWPWVKEARGNSEEYERRLYLATRSAWPVNVSKHANVKYAVSVALDIVRQVYSIDGWRPAEVDSRGITRQLDRRKMFDGSPVHSKSHLIGRAISPSLFGGGRQFPLRWIGPVSGTEPNNSVGK